MGRLPGDATGLAMALAPAARVIGADVRDGSEVKEFVAESCSGVDRLLLLAAGAVQGCLTSGSAVAFDRPPIVRTSDPLTRLAE